MFLRNKLKLLLCHLILLLEWIPSYRRYYVLNDPKNRALDKWRTEWHYAPPGNGTWGWHLLDRLNLAGWFIESGNEEDE